MRFSICVIEPAGYNYAHFLYDTCKYMCYGIESAGFDCCIVRNKFSTDRINIIVGAHNCTDPTIIEKIKTAGNYILLQSEIITGNSINQWSVQKSFADIYLPLMEQAQAVWDGVESNISQLKQIGIEAELLRFGYHPLMEEIHHKGNKDIDFLFCGSITSHRKKLLEQLIARGGKVVTMFDDAAMYRNDLIARTHVNLAPNQGPGMNHFGGGRVMYLINNRSMVVVERCYDQAVFESCFPSTDTDQWVDLCMEILHRPNLAQIAEEYYQRFKQLPMVDYIAPLLDKFIHKAEAPSHAAAMLSAHKALAQFVHQNCIPGLISIIILTHNRLEQTKKCLKSIRKHTPEPHEIIFVDNASTDGTVKWLQGQIRENKNYRLIENKENAGIAKGRNQGINLSQGEYILLLDNDVVLSDGWLAGMLECLNHAPDSGIVGPMTNSTSGLQQVADESYRSVEYLDKYAAQYKEHYRHRRIPGRNVAGFCMLFKRELVKRIGLLDERFNTGRFEDEDFCWRAALEDYRNYIAGDVFIHHHGGGKREPGNRMIINQKWTLSMATAEGKNLAVRKAIELADTFYSKGTMDKAVETLIDCIKYSPEAREIYYELARFFLESKKFSEAWEVVETMEAAAKNDLKGLACAGYAKEGLGLDGEADTYAERMLAANDQYPAALNLKGVLAYKKDSKEEAADYFRKAIHADPGYGEAHTNLGVLYWGQDKKDDALAHMKKGFTLSPTLPDASSIYYSVIASLGAFSDAEADFREACRLYPNNKNLAFLSIDILIQQAKFNDALLQIQDALASYGLDDGILDAALAVREKIGPLQIGKTAKKGTLSLCMIVKNEEKHLVRCLRSVRDVVDEMIIVDTGSSDKTVNIAKIFGAKIYDFPWTGDFSAARNYSLAQAKGDWILILDADEVISSLDFDELKSLIRKRTPSLVAYSILTRNYINSMNVIGWMPNNGQYLEEAGSGWVPSFKIRLIPRRKDVYFSNPVHELLENSLANAKIQISPCKIIVHHYGKLDLERDLQKGKDYYLLGKIKHEGDPTNMKHIYELAKQAYVLHMYDETVDFWLKLLSLMEADPQSSGYQEIAMISRGNPLAEIYTQLAATYILLDRYEEALKTSCKAMATETKMQIKESVYIYAQCEIIAGSLEKAFRALEELLIKTPDYPPALVLIAAIFCMEGKDEKYKELFQLMKRKQLEITSALSTIAKQLHTNGKKNEALRILHAMIDNRIDNEETGKLLDEYQKGQ